MYKSSGGVMVTPKWLENNVTSKLPVLEPLERVHLACRVARKVQELWPDDYRSLCSDTLALVEEWMAHGGGCDGFAKLYSAASSAGEIVESVVKKSVGVPVWPVKAVFWVAKASYWASILAGDLASVADADPPHRLVIEFNAKRANLFVTKYTHATISSICTCGVFEPATVSADMWVEIANDLKRAMGQKESASCCEEV